MKISRLDRILANGVIPGVLFTIGMTLYEGGRLLQVIRTRAFYIDLLLSIIVFYVLFSLFEYFIVRREG